MVDEKKDGNVFGLATVTSESEGEGDEATKKSNKTFSVTLGPLAARTVLLTCKLNAVSEKPEAAIGSSNPTPINLNTLRFIIVKKYGAEGGDGKAMPQFAFPFEKTIKVL